MMRDENTTVDVKDLMAGLLRASQDGMFLVRPIHSSEFLITDVNRMLIRFLGKDISGMRISEALDERQARWIRKHLLHVCRTGKEIILRSDAVTLGSNGQHIQVKLVPILSHNEVAMIAGSVHVMTDTQRIRENARRHKDRYATALEYAPYGVCFINSDLQPTMVNRALSRWLNQPITTLLKTDISSYVHEDERALFRQALKQVLETGRVYRGMDIRLQNDRDESIWTSLNISRVQESVGGHDYAILQFVDITRRKENEDRLVRLARRDHLTGLANRMLFEEELDMALKNARRYGRGGAILYIDLDDFKQVNDMFGHKAGDDVLREVARILTHLLRETDTIARLGGDEFAVIMQEISEEGAHQKADQVRKILNSASVVVHGKHVSIHGSVGVQTFSGMDDISRDDLLEAADRHMYRVKNAHKANLPINL